MKKKIMSSLMSASLLAGLAITPMSALANDTGSFDTSGAEDVMNELRNSSDDVMDDMGSGAEDVMGEMRSGSDSGSADFVDDNTNDDLGVGETNEGTTVEENFQTRLTGGSYVVGTDVKGGTTVIRAVEGNGSITIKDQNNTVLSTHELSTEQASMTPDETVDNVNDNVDDTNNTNEGYAEPSAGTGDEVVQGQPQSPDSYENEQNNTNDGTVETTTEKLDSVRLALEEGHTLEVSEGLTVELDQDIERAYEQTGVSVVNGLVGIAVTSVAGVGSVLFKRNKNE